ncbi:MAG: hypothetical protein Tp156SUR915002_3 [Prokaryotic dsDNA virus sp.]|mgnify:CR=1 FL=1|jgi:hypothetical protein|nr:MAG: hypothetical protein Tp162SUR384061_12 [Prokaryotic dsDNA virus sp.]QDP59742.1 MAG: hypothetical protein Tp156SUR915002_3 [Prokaryotic dsDNA virus sp.]|tara:strand:- start:29592 stop:30176 length:585 start_codon:yes stop_codon:yes gene_type:complete
MKIRVVRTQMGVDATNGLVFIDDVFECYSLEDEIREVKVYGETAIPEGTYPIEYRKEGGFHQRYKVRYGKDHFGMLEIKEIPNFKWVLFHSGNTDENSAGCILLGDTQQDLDMSKDGFIGSSRNAYKKFYDKVAKAMNDGEKVEVEISTIKFGKEISNKATDDVVLVSSVMAKLGQISGDIKTIKASLKNRNII